MTTVVFLFPKPIALLAVLYLAFGDPAAAITGTAIGKTKLWAKKSLEGALANFIVSATVTALFALFYLKANPEVLFALSVGGGLSSMLAESLPTRVDDNFTIPVVSALLMYPICFLLGVA
jgi:dolichol kinase